MTELLLILLIIWFIIGCRTALYWLQNWQIREYRFDRMRAHFFTQDGRRDLFNLWFFDGILPRPKISGRIILIGLLFAFFSYVFVYAIESNFGLGLLTIVLWERTIFLWIALSVLISDIPVFLARQMLFYRARVVMKDNKNVEVIGITGSFGKSSTKEILVHLLQSKFGKENVCYNPENQNNEVAIARLVLKNKKFFESKKQKFFVVEIGAYRVGEIKQVCDFIFPKIGIMTGLNAQHISLFGSQLRIQQAKFELAESASEKVFFNADNALLVQVFDDNRIHATTIPISLDVTKNAKKFPDKTEFEVYGKKMTLPWGGGFFVGNALLSMEVCREYGMAPEAIKNALKKLPPLKRALSVKKHKNGFTVLQDLYSANPDGVLAAIDHLDQFPGKKIFVGIPLLELGKNSEDVHEKIFRSLKKINANVFWWKSDFELRGKEICGEKFFGKNSEKLQKMAQELGSGDAVLLESRLPKKIVQIFE